MKMLLLCVGLLVCLTSGLVTDATSLDDVSFFLVKHSDTLAVMVFYDEAPNDHKYADFYRLFDDDWPDPILHQSLPLL